MGATMLVADDAEWIVELLAAVLERACDGVQALALLEHARPDLPLTDTMMPRLAGPGAAPAVLFLPTPFDLDTLLATVTALLVAAG